MMEESKHEYIISKEFSFEAAHQLNGLPPEHKCSRFHGHSYKVIVFLASRELNEIGFVVDYGDLKPLKDYIDQNMDHRFLNEYYGFNPTAENLAKHLYEFAKAIWPQVFAVEVKETEKTSAKYMEL